MRKRTKSEPECEEYVCPMDTEIPVPLQKIFSPRVRKAECVQQGLVTSKTRGEEHQVSEQQLGFLLSNHFNNYSISKIDPT